MINPSLDPLMPMPDDRACFLCSPAADLSGRSQWGVIGKEETFGEGGSCVSAQKTCEESLAFWTSYLL